MLEQKYRLKKNKEFGYIFKKGDNQFCKNLAVFFVKTKYFPSKIGFSISAKIGNSVIRHLVKRRLSEIVKSLLPRIDQGYNYIFMARKGIEQLEYKELQKNVEYVLDKCGKLK